MLTYFDLRKGVLFMLEGQPYEVLEWKQMRKAQDVSVVQTKVRNLITGKVIPRNFHQSDKFDEAELSKFKAKFLYNHRGKFVFVEHDNPAVRFELPQELVGETVSFLKPNEVVEGIRFEGKIINIAPPIKVQLKVVESPPGIKGDRAQGGTKSAVLESGANIQVPLFVEEGDTIEVNTETGEYVKRV
ncbi:MAG: elongation factor P [Candidatus Wildermuthbacteria bacterium]|nr:elongation factor P [Candidatus Wildermuthbacteria bacterium]